MTDTIELEFSLRALWRWKWLILLVSVLAGAVAAGVTVSGPTRYTTSALVKVGRVMDKELDDVYVVAEMMDSAGFQAAMRTRHGGPLPGAIDATAITGGQGRLEHPIVLRVTASAPTAEGAVAVGDAAVEELSARHKTLFDESVKTWREYEKVLAAAGEPATGPADPAARQQLYELRAKLVSPVTTFETLRVDPFPMPAAPVPKNTVVAGAVASVSTFAILILFVVAFAQIPGARIPGPSPSTESK